MDGVSARREFFAEFGSHDAAAAVSGIYRYADVHRKTCLGVFICLGGSKFKLLIFIFQVRRAGAGVLSLKRREAGDPRYRLPLLNLTHLLRGGASEGGSIELVSEISNDSCNEFLN